MGGMTRWLVRAEDALLAMEQDESGGIYATRVTVDAETRVVRHGAQQRVALPFKKEERVEILAVEEVQDRDLGLMTTVMVLRSLEEDETGSKTPPQKRMRRDSTLVRLRFCSLWKTDDSWALESLGDVAVPSALRDVRVFLTHGPHAIVFDPKTQTVTLVSKNSNADGEAAFAVASYDQSACTLTQANVKVLSCEYVDDLVTTTPHIRIHYTSANASSDSQTDLYLHHYWSALTPLDANTKLGSCSYMPQSIGSSSHEQITSFLLVPRSPLGVSKSLSTTRYNLVEAAHRSILLRPSTLSLIGTSANTLYVVSNGIIMSTIVLNGPPRYIRCVGSVLSSSNRLTIEVRCADSDSSFYLLSIGTTSKQSSAISVLQQFSFVGDCFLDFPVNETSNGEEHMILLNRSDKGAADHLVFLERLLRKSVLLSIRQSEDIDTSKTSCHRLKLRVEKENNGQQNGPRRKRARTEAPKGSQDAFQCIERIKVGARTNRQVEHSEDDDSVVHSLRHSPASRQQLLTLLKSLEHRHSIGLEQLRRLEAITRDKERMASALMMFLSPSVFNASNLIGQEAGPIMHSVISLGATGVTSSVAPAACEANPLYRVLSTTIHSFDVSRSSLSMSSTIQCRSDVVDISQLAVSTTVPGSLDPSGHRSWTRIISVDHIKKILEARVILELPISYLSSPVDSVVDIAVWVHSYASDGVDLTSMAGLYKIEAATLVERHAPRLPSCVESSMCATSELVLVSGGSSIPAIIRTARMKGQIEFPLSRPQVALVSISDLDFRAQVLSIRSLRCALPRDVVLLSNLLARASMKTTRSLLGALKVEMEMLQTLEAGSRLKGETKGSVLSRLFRQQTRTDLDAYALLTILQRRIDFHSLWYQQ
ncbi:hypothetical protein Poli38472_004287 [Pythium oligandrum]|uniref:Uncharacterized protein n=1 Tax=Pythium oligandrum TaxID=41045 RepID=A0A8K1CQ00_PYTOL|nr:hypothetical protein Poli38472_004287 [Pythium oligandrum]|eukprot:TMW66522.1 hypothetical protein Poli38472_004287 [Pythium oligandrum]